MLAEIRRKTLRSSRKTDSVRRRGDGYVDHRYRCGCSYLYTEKGALARCNSHWLCNAGHAGRRHGPPVFLSAGLEFKNGRGKGSDPRLALTEMYSEVEDPAYSYADVQRRRKERLVAAARPTEVPTAPAAPVVSA